MTGVLLQARLGSTRLPRKAVLDLCGMTVIEHAMRSLRRIPCSHHVVVTDAESAPTLEPLAKSAGFDLFTGSPENVLERYVHAARAYGLTEIIRATGDNPLVSWELARMAVAEFRRRGCDYFGYDGPPLGTGVEVLDSAALERALRESSDAYNLEHVSPYLYRNPELFACARVDAPPAYCVPKARVTIDTSEDYAAITAIFSDLYEGAPIANLTLVRWLRSRIASTEPPLRTLLVPETRPGHGSAHLRRSIRLLEALPGSSILLPRDRRNLSELIDGIADDRIIDDPGTVEDLDVRWDRIVLDRFSITEREMRAFMTRGCTLGIDLGGAGRQLCDYLIDTLPRLDHSSANAADEAFLDLPDPPAPGISGTRNKLERASSILVTFGGEDPAHLSEAVAHVLSRAGFGRSTTLVRPAMRELGEVPADIAVVPPQHSLTALIVDAGVVITAFGMTAYEARALATPTVTVGPTRYHDRLAKAAGFHRAGVGSPQSRKLVRLLQGERRERRVEPTARRSLAEEIVRLALPVGRGCPVHHEYGPALWRNAEKSYFVCPRCGLVYLERLAADGETYGTEYFMEEYRAQYGKTYLEDFEHIYAMGTRRLDRALGVARIAPETVLDIGCAYGPFLAAARDRGLSAYGLDVAEDAVEYVRTSLGIPAACASILDFSASETFGREAFDLVTLWYVIEHFARLDLLLPKLASLVRPGGVLAFSTPYGAGISARRNTSTFYDESPRDHYSVWNKSSTRRILDEFGFSVRRFEMTGHHPERYPAVRRGIMPRGVAAAHSSVFGRGDTFEVYATKEP